MLKLIAWALGTTSLAVGFSSMSAQAATCTAISTDPGGTSFSTADNIGTLCGGSKILTTSDDLPRYWEFNWGGTSSGTDISGAVTTGPITIGSNSGNGGSFIGNGSFYGNLNLYNPDGTMVAPTASFDSTGNPADSFAGTTRAYLNGVNLTPGSEYIVAIEQNLETDPAVEIDFSGSGSPSTVPLPASLPMLGGALAFLGLVRRLRRARA